MYNYMSFRNKSPLICSLRRLTIRQTHSATK